MAEDKQIKLEDIERDNLASEKSSKQPQPQIRGQPGGNPPQYNTAPQQFKPSFQIPQAPAAPQYQQALPKTLPQQNFQYLPVQYQSAKPQYVLPQQYLVENNKGYLPQQYYQVQYLSQATQNYPAIQSYPQQNYIYVQPEASSTNQIQQIAPQNGVQYVMFLEPNVEYLKNPHVQANIAKNDAHTHNLVGLLQRNAYTNTIPQNYRAPLPQPIQTPQPTPHQTFSFQPPNFPVPQTHQGPQYNIVPQQQYIIPGLSYTKNQGGDFDPHQGQQSVTSLSFIGKRQPTSLLDSYIPSVLQLQYYKQLQEGQS